MQTIGKICLSNLLMSRLEIPEQYYIKVRLGNLVVNTVLEVTNDQAGYSLSPNLAKALYLNKSRSLQIRYHKAENMIHLGPTIGILATSLPNRSSYERTSTQAELIFISDMRKRINGIVFLFTPNCINWENNTVKGYIYSHSPGVWVPATYPIPDVVYDRIASRGSEIKYNSVRERLMQLPYLKYFNPSYLNKWHVHKMLMNEPTLKNNLPDTMKYSKENLRTMLNLYNVVFVKPSDGSLGLGIIRIIKTEQGTLKYTVYRNKRSRRQASDVDDFFKKTRKIISDKPYIVQQGLNLATYRGSPFDLRIIYQKDGKGEWIISKKFVRVAAKGSNVSNLSSGGRVAISSRVLKYLFKRKDLIEAKNKEIENLCYKVATTLENVSNQIYGELGLDIGIDKNGNPWLIEVNSKPRKATDTEFSMTVVRNTFIRPLEYAVHLAGFIHE